MSTVAWSALSFFLGLILGHRLSLHRDKRKELNEVLAPIRAWVIAQAGHPQAPVKKPGNVEFDAFASRLSEADRKRLGRACVQLRDSWKYSEDVIGQPQYRLEKPEEYGAAMKVIIELTQPR